MNTPESIIGHRVTWTDDRGRRLNGIAESCDGVTLEVSTVGRRRWTGHWLLFKVTHTTVSP